MWQVCLTGNIANQELAFEIYGADFFPRKFHYKQAAEMLVYELNGFGIQAKVRSI